MTGRWRERGCGVSVYIKKKLKKRLKFFHISKEQFYFFLREKTHPLAMTFFGTNEILFLTNSRIRLPSDGALDAGVCMLRQKKKKLSTDLPI